MLNADKTARFETIGELKELLKDVPDNTKVAIIGVDDCFFHIEEDNSVICLDTEDLTDGFSLKYFTED